MSITKVATTHQNNFDFSYHAFTIFAIFNYGIYVWKSKAPKYLKYGHTGRAGLTNKDILGFSDKKNQKYVKYWEYSENWSCVLNKLATQ